MSFYTFPVNTFVYNCYSTLLLFFKQFMYLSNNKLSALAISGRPVINLSEEKYDDFFRNKKKKTFSSACKKKNTPQYKMVSPRGSTKPRSRSFRSEVSCPCEVTTGARGQLFCGATLGKPSVFCMKTAVETKSLV